MVRISACRLSPLNPCSPFWLSFADLGQMIRDNVDEAEQDVEKSPISWLMLVFPLRLTMKIRLSIRTRNRSFLTLRILLRQHAMSNLGSSSLTKSDSLRIRKS